MNLALGIAVLWVGAALLWVAFQSNDPAGTKPWDVFKEVTDAIKGGGASSGAASQPQAGGSPSGG